MESQEEEQLSYKLYFAKWRILQEEENFEEDGWVLFDEHQIKEFEDFVQKERKDFLATNPNHAEDVDMWNAWMHDAWKQSEIIALCPNAFGYYVDAYVTFVDLEHPKIVG